MAKKIKRPPSVVAGDLHARPVRGPREGDGLWYWRCERRADGERGTVWTGWATREGAARELARIVAGVTPPAPAAPAGAPTVRTLLGYWLGAIEGRPDLSPQSKRIYARACARIVADPLGDTPIAAVARRVLESWRDRRLSDGAMAATVRIELTALGIAWRWALEPDGPVVTPRPLPRVVVRGRPAERPTPAPADVARIVEWHRALRLAWPARAVWLLAVTGCRIGEIADLRWGALGECLRVRGKTGAREVPLSAEARAEIESWGRLAPDARVWGPAGEHVRKTVNEGLRRCGQEIGLPGLSAHALRRAACDALYQGGVDISAAAAILGHSPQVALTHYRRPSAADLRAAIAAAGLGSGLAHKPGAQSAENGPAEVT